VDSQIEKSEKMMKTMMENFLEMTETLRRSSKQINQQEQLIDEAAGEHFNQITAQLNNPKQKLTHVQKSINTHFEQSQNLHGAIEKTIESSFEAINQKLENIEKEEVKSGGEIKAVTTKITSEISSEQSAAFEEYNKLASQHQAKYDASSSKSAQLIDESNAESDKYFKSQIKYSDDVVAQVKALVDTVDGHNMSIYEPDEVPAKRERMDTSVVLQVESDEQILERYVPVSKEEELIESEPSIGASVDESDDGNRGSVFAEEELPKRVSLQAYHRANSEANDHVPLFQIKRHEKKKRPRMEDQENSGLPRPRTARYNS